MHIFFFLFQSDGTTKPVSKKLKVKILTQKNSEFLNPLGYAREFNQAWATKTKKILLVNGKGMVNEDIVNLGDGDFRSFEDDLDLKFSVK